MSGTLALVWREWRLMRAKLLLLALVAAGLPLLVFAGVALSGSDAAEAAMLAATFVAIPLVALLLGAEASTPDGAASLLHALPASPARVALVRLVVRAALLVLLALAALGAAALVGGRLDLSMPVGRAGALGVGQIALLAGCLTFACAALASGLSRRATQALVAGASLLACVGILAYLCLDSVLALSPWTRGDLTLVVFGWTSFVVLCGFALGVCAARRSEEPAALRRVLKVAGAGALGFVVLLVSWGTIGDAVARARLRTTVHELAPALATTDASKDLRTPLDVTQASAFLGKGSMKPVLFDGDEVLLRDSLRAEVARRSSADRTQYELQAAERKALSDWLHEHGEDLARLRGLLLASNGAPVRIVGPSASTQVSVLHSTLLLDARSSARNGDPSRAESDLLAAHVLSDSLLHDENPLILFQGVEMAGKEARLLKELPHVDAAWDAWLAADLRPRVTVAAKAALRSELHRQAAAQWDVEAHFACGSWTDRPEPVLRRHLVAWFLRPAVRWRSATLAPLAVEDLNAANRISNCEAPQDSTGVMWWPYLTRANRERELARLVIAARAERERSGTWPAGLPTIANASCERDWWQWQAGDDGSASLHFVGPSVLGTGPLDEFSWSSAPSSS